MARQLFRPAPREHSRGGVRCPFPRFLGLFFIRCTLPTVGTSVGSSGQPPVPPLNFCFTAARRDCTLCRGCNFCPLRCVSPPRPRTSGTSTSSTRCARGATTRSGSAGSCKVRSALMRRRALPRTRARLRGGGGRPFEYLLLLQRESGRDLIHFFFFCRVRAPALTKNKTGGEKGARGVGLYMFF